MACGVTVLASGEASLPEVTGDCALICNAYSEKSIAKGLYRLYKDENLRNELSSKGLKGQSALHGRSQPKFFTRYTRNW